MTIEDAPRSMNSEKMKSHWANMSPEDRAERVRKMAEGKRGKTYTPSQTKPMRARQTWANRTREERLEIRRKQSETMKATWARRKELIGTHVEEAKVIGRPIKRPAPPTPPTTPTTPIPAPKPVLILDGLPPEKERGPAIPKPKVQILDWV